jgi:hypothetical protein
MMVWRFGRDGDCPKRVNGVIRVAGAASVGDSRFGNGMTALPIADWRKARGVCS